MLNFFRPFFSTGMYLLVSLYLSSLFVFVLLSLLIEGVLGLVAFLKMSS